jgi:hypothetical protein
VTIRRFIHAFLLIMIGAAVTGASDQPSPRFRFDLSPFLTEPQQNVHLAFMGDDRLFVTTGEFRSNGLVFNLNSQQLEQRVPLGNCYVIRVWSTPTGNLAVFCRDHFTVYDRDFHVSAELPLERWGPSVEISPNGRLFALDQSYTRRNAAGEWVTYPSHHLIEADTLKQLQSNMLAEFGPITDDGLIVSKPDGLYFSPFAGGALRPLIKFKPKPGCEAYSRVLGPDRLIVWSCRARLPIVINLAGTSLYTVNDADGLATAIPSVSGDRFLFVFQRETRSYAFKHGVNLLEDLAGADIPPNLDMLRAYDGQSGKLLLELKWKLQSGDPVFGGFGEGVGALSRNGTALAAIRGRSLEVYQIPKN